MCRVVIRVCLLALLLAACSGPPLHDDVIAQATADGEVAFNVVKIDDAVVNTLLQRPRPNFQRRFKKHPPPPELKIGIGDTVSVVIWESAANGLFGTSLTEWSLPAGAVARRGLSPLPGSGQLPAQPGDLSLSPDLLAQMLGAAGAPSLPALRAPDATAGLKPSDLNALRLRGLVDQTGRPGTQIPDQQVGSDGAISIPYAGRIKVAGHTPEEVARRIEKLLRPKALDPQALVAIKNSTANSVSVSGDIIGGTRVPLSPGGDRLLQVIAAAGGAKTPPHDTFVRLSRGGTTATVSLGTLVADPEQNIFAEPGDVLTLVQRSQTFSVFGAAGKNAAVTFDGERLSLTEALAKAGGLLDERADPQAVFLLRYEPVDMVRALGQPIAARSPEGLAPIVYRLDLREAKSYLLGKRFPVQDKDVIFVANAETVPVTQALQALSKITGPIVRSMLLCRRLKNC